MTSKCRAIDHPPSSRAAISTALNLCIRRSAAATTRPAMTASKLSACVRISRSGRNGSLAPWCETARPLRDRPLRPCPSAVAWQPTPSGRVPPGAEPRFAERGSRPMRRLLRSWKCSWNPTGCAGACFPVVSGASHLRLRFWASDWTVRSTARSARSRHNSRPHRGSFVTFPLISSCPGRTYSAVGFGVAAVEALACATTFRAGSSRVRGCRGQRRDLGCLCATVGT